MRNCAPTPRGTLKCGLKLLDVICISGELYTVPGMQKDLAIQERKPSSISTDSNDSCKDKNSKDNAGAVNWSCNAGDSGITLKDGAGVKPSKDQNWSSNAKDGVMPKKEPCPVAQNCDLEFRVLPPTGLCILLVVNSL